MEKRFGHDFSHVRIHADDVAAASASRLGADAYTVESSVVFGAERYAPATAGGRTLLAHELAHVVQQDPRRHGNGAGETALEHDAEAAARAVGRGARAQVHTRSAPRLSRQPERQPVSTPGVSLIEVSCAINEIRFHTRQTVVSYKLTECDLDEGDYQAKVLIDRRRNQVRFELGESAPEGVHFHFDYHVGPDQPAPTELLRGQATVAIKATNLPPRDAKREAPPAAVADLTANVAHIPSEEALRACQSGDLRVKTFPYRATRFGAAPIDAWHDGPYIRVKQPVYVLANDDFRRQTRTLPAEAFTSGVRLYPDEIVKVRLYEPPWYKLNVTGSTDGDDEREFCVTGEQMLQIAEASTKATLINIGLTAFEAGTLFVPVGKVAQPLLQGGRTGLAAAMIGTADVAPTAFAGVASHTAATVVVEQQVERQVVGQAVRQTVAATAEQVPLREATQAAVSQGAPRLAPGVGAAAARATAGTAAHVAGGRVQQAFAPSPSPAAPSQVPAAPSQLPAIPGAQEVRVSQAEYEAALRLTFPSQHAHQLAVIVDGIGDRAAQRAVANPRFVAAVQSGDATLAGTLFHSAAAQEVREFPASALPGGWAIEAERTIQAGAGGSRADVLLRGPAGEIIEVDWKTSGRSALSYGSRGQMARHAGQISTNIAGQLTTQESRSWIDYVRALLPGGNGPR